MVVFQSIYRSHDLSNPKVSFVNFRLTLHKEEDIEKMRKICEVNHDIWEVGVIEPEEEKAGEKEEVKKKKVGRPKRAAPAGISIQRGMRTSQSEGEVK